MPSTINASTSSGIVQTADTSGVLELQSNGTTRLSVLSTGVSGTLIQGTAVTASGTAVDFTSIPTWVKRVTVMFSGVSTNGTSALLVQIGSGSFTTSGYSSFGARTAGTTVATSSSTAGFFINLTTAADSIIGSMSIQTVNTNLWVANYVCGYNTAGSVHGGGSVTLGGTLDRVRITTVNGTDTFDAGSINIQYEG